MNSALPAPLRACAGACARQVLDLRPIFNEVIFQVEHAQITPSRGRCGRVRKKRNCMTQHGVGYGTSSFIRSPKH